MQAASDFRSHPGPHTITLTPTCFTPPCKVTIDVPNGWDAEEYIDEYLDSILNDDVRYNAEWDFESP